MGAKMRKLWVMVIVISSFITSLNSAAQRGPRRGTQFGRMYDVTTVQTINAVVVRIDTLGLFGGTGYYGIHLLVTTENEQIPVHLGPALYLNELNNKISLKDTVTITGSRITYEGKPAIIAREIQDGNQRLQLRDNNGLPLWRGWRGGMRRW